MPQYLDSVLNALIWEQGVVPVLEGSELEVTVLATVLMHIRACRLRYLELNPRCNACVLSPLVSVLVFRAFKPVLSAPLWTQEKSSPAPHLHGWMRVQLSPALGRTQAQAGRVSVMRSGQEWC